MKNIIVLPLLVAILGPAVSAQTVEGAFAKAGCIAAGVKPVCRGRADLVEATLKSLAAAEKGVSLYGQGYGSYKKDKDALSVEQAVALVDENAATNSGVCVYKTVIEYLQAKGEIGSYIHTEEHGDDFALLIDDVNGGKPVLYKNAGQVGDYAKQSLTHYFYGIEESYEPTLKERCKELERMPKGPGYTTPDYCVELLKQK